VTESQIRLHEEFSEDKIDPNILDFILLCRANGFRTFACCEGHIQEDRCDIPYVALIQDEGSMIYDTFERFWAFLLENGYDEFFIRIERTTDCPDSTTIHVTFWDFAVFNPENRRNDKD
jgi:hypothetical protein